MHTAATESKADAEAATEAVTLSNLDDQSLISIFSMLAVVDAASATATCHALHQVREQLWQCMLVERFASALPQPASPAAWGLPSSAALLSAAEQCIYPWTSQYWLLLSDHPWCQLHAIRPVLDMDGNVYELVGSAVSFTLGPNVQRIDHPPTFTIRLAGITEGTDVTDGADGADGGGGGARPALFTADARIHIGTGVAAVLSHEDPAEMDEADARAGLLGGFAAYPDRLSLSFVHSIHAGEPILRLAWSADDHMAAGVLDAQLEDAAARQGWIGAPPLSLHWLATALATVAREASRATGPIPRLAARLRRLFSSGRRAERLPSLPNECAISLSRLPTELSAFSPPPSWAEHGYALPTLGLYMADYGPHYAPRNHELILVRIVCIGEGANDDASARAAAKKLRRALHIDYRAGREVDYHTAHGTTYAIIATKITGDLHVPSGACTFFIPLEAYERRGTDDVRSCHHLNPKDVEGQLYWQGFGCLAAPGFNGAHFQPGQLRVLDTTRFTFDWRGENEKTYYLVPPHHEARNTASRGGDAQNDTVALG